MAYIKDDSGRHIYCNKTLSKKFAISPEEFIGTTAYDFFPKQEAKRLEGHDRKIRSQKTTINVPPWNDGNEDNLRWWQEVKFPVAGPSNKTFVAGIALEITDLMQSEEALKQSEERYRLLVEGSPASIFAIRNGKILFANPAAARMLGFSDPETLKGLTVLDFVAPESQKLVAKRVQQIEKGKDNPSVEIELIRQGGARITVESTSVSIPIDGLPTAVVIAQDISERKENEEMLHMMKFTMDNASDRIAWISPAGLFLYANEAGYRDLHFTKEEVLSMGVPDVDPNFTQENWL